MREVFVSRDHARVGLFKSVLDDAGIPSYIRNEYTNNAFTSIPSPLFFPVLCVIHEEDYDDAMRVLGATDTAGPDWKCPKCAAEVPGNYAVCWQCGSFHPDSVAAEE